MTLDAAIEILDQAGYSLVLDRKRCSKQWKAQAWNGPCGNDFSGWAKGDRPDGIGPTPEAAVISLLFQLDLIK